YGEKTVRIKNAKGLQDIASMIASPGKHIHVADLIAASTVAPLETRSTGIQLTSAGLEALGGSGAGRALDARARAAYRTRLAELRADLEEADGRNDVGRAEQA